MNIYALENIHISISMCINIDSILQRKSWLYAYGTAIWQGIFHVSIL